MSNTNEAGDSVEEGHYHPMDLNKDGKVDKHDLIHAAKVTGISVSAAAAAVGVTAATAAVAGSALVGSTATGIGTTIAATGGAVVGSIAGLYAGTSTFGMVAVTQIGSALFIQGVTITTVSSSVIASWTAGTTALAVAGEVASGFIAGLPIVQTVAVAKLKASGDVIVIGGAVLSVNAAIAMGIVAAIIAGGVVYYVLLSDDKKKVEAARCQEPAKEANERHSSASPRVSIIQRIKRFFGFFFSRD